LLALASRGVYPHGIAFPSLDNPIAKGVKQSAFKTSLIAHCQIGRCTDLAAAPAGINPAARWGEPAQLENIARDSEA